MEARFNLKVDLSTLEPSHLEDLLANHTPDGTSTFKLFVDSVVEFFPTDEFLIGDKDNLQLDASGVTVFYPYNPLMTIISPLSKRDEKLSKLRDDLLSTYLGLLFHGEPEEAIELATELALEERPVSGFYKTPLVGLIASTTALSECLLEQVEFTDKTLLSRRLVNSAKDELAKYHDIPRGLFFKGQGVCKEHVVVKL